VPDRPRFRALALLGRLLLVHVDSVVMQASEKPQQQETRAPQQIVCGVRRCCRYPASSEVLGWPGQRGSAPTRAASPRDLPGSRGRLQGEKVPIATGSDPMVPEFISVRRPAAEL